MLTMFMIYAETYDDLWCFNGNKEHDGGTMRNEGWNEGEGDGGRVGRVVDDSQCLEWLKKKTFFLEEISKNSLVYFSAPTKISNFFIFLN